MKKTLLIAILSCLISSVFTQDFKINSAESVVEFNYVSEEAVGTIKGVSGKIHFDVTTPLASYFEVNADIKSINTSNKTRDKHLNAADFFYTEKYPYISFKSESLSVNEKNFILVGALSIKEISKKEEIKFTYENKVFVGRMVIYSNDYGIKEQKTREKSKILVKITVPIF
mgnify:CR=1 FL=1|jgi:polyisoprenoid-binding protein YceI